MSVTNETGSREPTAHDASFENSSSSDDSTVLSPEAFTIEGVTLDRLQSSLFAKAAADGIADVTYFVMDSPVGPLFLAATATGLVKVSYIDAGIEEILEELAARISPRIVPSESRLEEAARQLTEYFEGRRQHFTVPLDRQLSHGFRLEVQDYLLTIAFGDTASYGEVADLVGHPRAARAVGTACATNPLPIVIPCHRVIRSDGSLGRYGHCTDVKKVLLELEHAL